MSGPAVVVGVPAYARAAWLRDSLDSLLAQTYRDVALVVVDDCSPDGSYEIALEYAARDPRVHAVRNAERLGLVGTWWRAFELARERHPSARYFAWGSDHDLWEPDWLEALVAVLDAHPEAVLAYPYSIRLDERGDVVPLPPWSFDTAGERSPARRVARCGARMSAGNMVYGLFRASALERAGPFQAVVGPDRLLLAHLAVLGEFHQVPRLLWRRRFADKVTTDRQRRSIFPGRRAPLHAHLPWWLVHGAILLRRYAIRGEGRPALGRGAATAAALSYVARSAAGRARRRAGRMKTAVRRFVARHRPR